ncbi:MAG: tRNA (guanosine(37)-N1)-methyltransferase TrmD [Eubacteriales bacterium]|nr:tRNA (guanosine(37)-N1)-methyltransferase TrmD [Eubacteriales bacterium]MDD4105510.1 tRNA (guanosine(37)-N1)-methyltransferase TrmD [Eubacteriales bacterium]MDD4710027.1 tRNA (guanosine(37)-N1)-methyltransferase TrmD [Eubacteriales bacterium]NLO15942.1 tRNA (guanosine(37)-N1)-methyltransferase TrmD [Clostridiales bacterium]
MEINVLTLFPEMFSALDASILGRAQGAGLLCVHLHNIRDYSSSKHKNADDYPFGGGAGMLMMPQPIADAFDAITPEPYAGKRIFMSAGGTRLDQQLVRTLSRERSLTVLCGHYEGVDQRVIDRYIDMEISIGDYVLTGGELPAMVLIDAVARMLKGVLGSEESAQEESFSGEGLLEYPQYTRPREFRGMSVPEVLLNGNHADINRWRRQMAIDITRRKRPDLMQTSVLTHKERERLQLMDAEEGKDAP